MVFGHINQIFPSPIGRGWRGGVQKIRLYFTLTPTLSSLRVDSDHQGRGEKVLKNLDTHYNKMLKKSIKSMRIEEFRDLGILKFAIPEFLNASIL
jgi:hypothetical protein